MPVERRSRPRRACDALDALGAHRVVPAAPLAQLLDVARGTPRRSGGSGRSTLCNERPDGAPRRAARTASPGNEVGRQCPSLSERIRRWRIAAARRRQAAAGSAPSRRRPRSRRPGCRRGSSVAYATKPASPPPTIAHSRRRLISPSRRAAPARSSAGRRRTRPAGSRSEKNEAGAIRSMFEPNWRRLEKIATVIGCVFGRTSARRAGRSTSRGTGRSRARRSPAARAAGSGARRSVISEAPSIRADSRMSFGIPMKKLRSRKIANGSPNAVWKRIERRARCRRCRGCCRARRSGSAPSAAARRAARSRR